MVQQAGYGVDSSGCVRLEVTDAEFLFYAGKVKKVKLSPCLTN
jgi:lipoprotein-anchoring transpeptidase ErfK/SrfK